MNKIKVVALTKKESGSIVQRIIYPLNKIQGLELDGKEIEITFKESENLTVEEIKRFDILIYHWNCPFTIDQLKELQEAQVKIIYSIDDTFNIEENNSNYLIPGLREYAKARVIQHLKSADAVIVSVERLAIMYKEYNDNIAILPNFLDPKDFKIEKTKSEYLRIGIIGSASHIDNFLSLKSVINRLAKNKTISEKCEFHLCGNDGSVGWKQIIKMFKVKKHLKVIVKDYSSTDDYFKLYENLDVCLLPLLPTEFNMCRSALRLNECAIANVLPIGSALYSFKELRGIVVCNNYPKMWEETILEILDEDNYEKILKYVTDINLKDADFEKRFENTKAVIGAVYLMERGG